MAIERSSSGPDGTGFREDAKRNPARKNMKKITSNEKIFRLAFGHIYIYSTHLLDQEELTKDRREEEGRAKSYGIAEDSCLRRLSKEVGLYRNFRTMECSTSL